MDVIELLISDHRLIQRLADDLCRPHVDAEESAAVLRELTDFVQFHFEVEEKIFAELPDRNVALNEILELHRKIENLLFGITDFENASQVFRLLRNQLQLTHRLEEKLIFSRMKLDLSAEKIKSMTALYLGFGKQMDAA